MTKKSPAKTPQLVAAFQNLGREDAGVGEALGREIAERFGPRDEAALSILAHDEKGALIGGLNGVTHWRWLYVKHLWVTPSCRGQGLGRDLLKRAEGEARARHCLGLYLDTFDPEAAVFYERCGFAPCGEIEDFPPGHRRIFSSKRLDRR